MNSSIYTLLIVISLSITSTFAQTSTNKTVQVKISGNCAMCKSTIEKAGNKKKESAVVWDEKSGIATLSYDENKTSPDAILKQIALAGYDNESYLAPNDAYTNLHECCQYDRELKEDLPPADKQAPTSGNQQEASAHSMEHEHYEADADSKAQLLTIYFTLKDALVNSDTNQAKDAGNKLTKSIASINVKELPANEQQVWTKEVNNLSTTAKLISEAKNIDTQRSAFTKLSASLYKLVKTSATEQKIYYQFCPMYNDGEGAYWLSKESKIKNPYYGSQMLTCGKTVESI